MVDTIESAIVGRLESQITDLTIKAFPSRPEEFKKLPVGHKGIVLVAYSGSSLGAPTNMDVLIQERVLEFSITLQIRDLRGHDGAYDYLDDIRAALSGWSPTSDDRVMFMTSESLLRLIDNLWVWGQTWRLTVRQASEVEPADNTDEPESEEPVSPDEPGDTGEPV